MEKENLTSLNNKENKSKYIFSMTENVKPLHLSSFSTLIFLYCFWNISCKEFDEVVWNKNYIKSSPGRSQGWDLYKTTLYSGFDLHNFFTVSIRKVGFRSEWLLLFVCIDQVSILHYLLSHLEKLSTRQILGDRKEVHLHSQF